MASRRASAPLSAATATVFGVGVDIAYIPRFRKCFARHGDRFLRRALHPSEIAEFYAKPTAAQPGFLASRWAAKEAAFKAFQRYRVLFPEIRLVKQGDSANRSTSAFAPPPHVQTALPFAKSSLALRLEFSGETQALAQQLHLVEPHVSISHDEDYAIAYVVLQQQMPQSPPPEAAAQVAETDKTAQVP